VQVRYPESCRSCTRLLITIRVIRAGRDEGEGDKEMGGSAIVQKRPVIYIYYILMCAEIMSTTTTTTTLARFFRIVCARATTRACNCGRLSNQEIRADPPVLSSSDSHPREKEMASDVAGTIGDQLNENGILYQN